MASWSGCATACARIPLRVSRWGWAWPETSAPVSRPPRATGHPLDRNAWDSGWQAGAGMPLADMVKLAAI
jgi:hypothetical protein